jgi:phosphoglucosamine mutase
MGWRPFRNAGLKIAALVLGAALWFTVSGEQVERSLQVPLSFGNLSPGLRLMDHPATVDVQVRGGAPEIGGLQSTDVSVVADLTGREPGEAVIMLRVDRVSAPSGIEVTQITPSTVTVTLEPVSTLSVPVQVTYQGQPAPGYVISHATVEPLTVDVTGPASRLRSPVVAVTEPVLVGGATADVVQTVGVGVTDPDLQLARPVQVEVTVRIEGASPERVIDARRVEVRNLESGDEVTVDPEAVTVVVRRQSGALGGLDASLVRPFVDLSGIGPGSHDAEVAVDLPVGYALVRIRPSTVTDRLFGTDGIRGVAGAAPLDPPTVARVGNAMVRVLGLERPARVILGRDTRESGEWIERELARGAAAAGAAVHSAGIVPTPVVAYLAGARDFDLGVVLSASHNPYEDNGIKVFSGRGEKFGEAEERAVELAVADRSWTLPGGAEPVIDASALLPSYLEHVSRLLPTGHSLVGIRLAVDLANGATTTTAARLLGELGFRLVSLGDQPDGRNINLACGSTHPAKLSAAVVEHQCRLGVAFDGDGDRAIFVDHAGRVVDGDAVLLMLGLHEQRSGRLAGDTVVATVMSNIGLELALGRHDIRLRRTPVGDKYVTEEMRANGFVLGGEQSGHVILARHLSTGDGLATALAVLTVMAETGLELAELAADLVTYPQTLVNVRVREKRPVARVPEIQAAVDRVEAALAGQGRVLVRYSGTEPLLRIMIEGQDQASVQAWAEEIAGAARETLG